ncbi:MAG: hypothetical protein II828_00635 [Clostridia bacterium]|nr:hypothetical protein [Clostridia bacterium]
MKSENEIYLETGILGGYRPEEAVLRKAEGGGVDTLYRDSHYTISEKEYSRERQMLIRGKCFVVTSVFPTDAIATPTDKMLFVIDGDLEHEEKVI